MITTRQLAAMGAAAARFGRRDADRVLPSWCSAPLGKGDVSAHGIAEIDPAMIPAAADLGRVHLVGIGGAGMSGIARILLARGVRGLRQ